MSIPDPMKLVHPKCENFKWYEVWKSEVAERMEFDNESEDEQVQKNAKGVVKNILQPLRNEFGRVAPQSWYRGERLERHITVKSFRAWCERKKKAISEATWQQYFKRKSHPKGGTVDIEVGALSNDDLFEYILDTMKFDQLIREFPKKGIPNSGWVHVSWAGKENRNQAFELTSKGIVMRN